MNSFQSLHPNIQSNTDNIDLKTLPNTHPNTKKKYKVVTLGCRTNQYESQAYRDQLQQMGWTPALENEQADLCIVNTCTVTESADGTSRHEIRLLAKHNPGARIVVTGCSVERQPEKIKSIEGVTDLIPNANKETLLNFIFQDEDVPEFSIKNFDAHTRAFVKIQDGCNSFCTYCIIPYVRGRSRSRSTTEILAEAKALVANGFKEIVLTGINIGDFDGGVPEGVAPERLSDLIRQVDEIPGLSRLRVSSIDPDEVDDDLMEAIINGRTTCHSMHIVLQSGSNIILKKMNRKYTRQMFFEAIDKMRQARPDFTFTTDVIVGFPGETEADFQETLDVMREVKFTKVHMFPYSPRPRTRAASYPNHVPQDVIRERKHRVLEVSEQIAFELRNQFVGRQMSVLTESFVDGRPGRISGHTDNFLPVLIDDENIAPNTLVEVELYENTPEGLIGRVLKGYEGESECESGECGCGCRCGCGCGCESGECGCEHGGCESDESGSDECGECGCESVDCTEIDHRFYNGLKMLKNENSLKIIKEKTQCASQ